MDLKPAGKFVAVDVDKAGGIPVIAQRLVEGGYVDGSAMTVTGRTFAEEAADAKETPGQEVIHPLSKPIKKSGGLVILRGSLAPDGCVIKVTGIERTEQRGPARVFESEEAAMAAVLGGKIRAGDIVVIRYEGPRGGPGMREMLGVTSAIVGAGLSDSVALLTDGRFSGATRGFLRGPCRAGSRGRRPDRRGSGRRHHLTSISRNEPSIWRFRRATHSGAPCEMESARAALPLGCLRQICGAGGIRFRRSSDDAGSNETGLRRCAGLKVSVQHLLNIRLADGADFLLHHFAAFEQQQRGDTAHVVAHAGRAVFIDVQLPDLHAAGVVGSDRIHGRRHHAAWPAPLGPKVHQDRGIGIQHVLIPARIGKCKRISTSHNV